MEKPPMETGTPKSPEEKKMYVFQTCSDGETWDTLEESEDKDALSAKLRELAHSGADQHGIDYRIIEK